VQARRAVLDDWREERLVLDSTASLDDNVRVALDHLGAVSKRADSPSLKQLWAHAQQRIRHEPGRSLAEHAHTRYPPGAPPPGTWFAGTDLVSVPPFMHV
jgi:hypothetical protein